MLAGDNILYRAYIARLKELKDRINNLHTSFMSETNEYKEAVKEYKELDSKVKEFDSMVARCTKEIAKYKSKQC